MSNHTETIARILMAVIVLLPLMSCEDPSQEKATASAKPEDKSQPQANSSATPLYQPAVEDTTFVQAIINGGSPDNLQNFDKKLREGLGLMDEDALASKMIGCVEGCDNFGTATPPDRLVYVFPRGNADLLVKFGDAWDKTQKEVNKKSFAMRIDADLPKMDCDTVNDPQPCQSYSFCPVDRCGRKMSTGAVNCSIC